MEEDQCCKTVTQKEDARNNRAAAADGFVLFLQIKVLLIDFKDISRVNFGS